MGVPFKEKTVREFNIELLRIFLMLMIIGYHLIVRGAGVGGANDNYIITDNYSVAYILLKSFLVIAVNCFVFISGFYRISFRSRTVISLMLQTTFYALIIHLGFTLLTGAPFGLRLLVNIFLPLFNGTWWFITAYLGLYLVSPLLNKGIDSCTREQLLFVLVVFTVLNAFVGFLFSSEGVLGTNGGFS